jgi:hypothetical protein
MTVSTTDMARRIDQWRMPTKPPTALMCWSSLPGHRMSDPSSNFYGFDAIGVPVQDCQIETIAQKGVVLGGKVFLDSRQVSREGL